MGYTVTSSVGAKTCTAASTARTCTVTGLTTGQSYTFTVTATNTSGTSGVSNAVTVTPMEIPIEVVDGIPTAVAGNASVTLSWTNKASANVTGYLVTASPGGATCIAATSVVSNPSCTVSGLTNGTAYTFTVKTTNAAGSSLTASAASLPATARTVPAAPAAPTVTPGSTQAVVSWAEPLNDGGDTVTEYEVTSNPGSFTCTTSLLTCAVSGLNNGTAYTFTVAAKNQAGYSLASAASTSATPRTNPGAPTAVLVTAGNAHAIVTWSAPASTGGASISEYQVRAYDGNEISRGVCTVNMPAALSCDVTGLSNGTPYTFAVFAYNSEGYGPRSTHSSAVTPLSRPGAPMGVQVLANDESVLVTWTPPADDGGAALTSFTATSDPGGHTCTATAPDTICHVRGLTNGQAYTFTVSARTSAYAIVGDGNSSLASAPATPLTVPDSPVFTALTPGDGFLGASFSAPASDGGNAISRYEYSADNGTHWTSFGSLLTSSPQNITGLIPGRNYDVLIRAVNAAGAGASSSMLSATFVTAPAAPTGLTGVAGDAGVALAWAAPTTTGGRTLISYTASASPGGASCTVLAPITTCDIGGLTNGVEYTFSVTAMTTIGTGPAGPSSVELQPLSPIERNTTFEIQIDLAVGDPVAGGVAEISGTGLEPSSPWKLVIYSTPRLLTSGTAGVSGTILDNAVIPSDLEAGWHALKLSGFNYLGEEASSTTWFEVNEVGKLVGYSRVDPRPDASATTAHLATTGAPTWGTQELVGVLMLATGGALLARRRRAG